MATKWILLVGEMLAALTVACGGSGTASCVADGVCNASCASDPDCTSGSGTGGGGNPSGGDLVQDECTGVDAVCAETPEADCLSVSGCVLKTTSPALGGYYWMLWQNPGSTAAWQFAPDATRVGASMTSVAESNAGISLQLDSSGGPIALSGYTELSFIADVAADVSFEVGLTSGGGTRGCTWDLIGVGGTSTYVVNLSTPDSYWANEDVAFDLTDVEVVSFASDWLTAASLDVVVTNVALGGGGA